MRALTLSAVAALALLAAGPALAGDPRGGGHHGPPPGPPPGPCCGHGGGHGGGSRNVNINVNASAHAAASATSHLNARTLQLGGFRGGHGGGTIYVGGGGYGGDAGYGYVGAPVYYDIDRRVLACASAPFGYVVTGFGRDGRRPPSCGGRHEYESAAYDRGGRYGYSERHDSYEESSYRSYESYEEFESYEAYETAESYEDRERRDCDCREPAPYPPAYLPEPPRYEPPSRPRPYEPRRESPPRQQYRQEPGERG